MSESVSRYNAKTRPQKQTSYEFLFAGMEGAAVETAGLMPSAKCLDVMWLLEHKVITPQRTQLYVVERDGDAHCAMIERLGTLGFKRGINLHDACCDLHEFGDTLILPEKLDLVFIDLFGSILLKDAQWMATKLAPLIRPTSRVCMTVQALARNNCWIDEVWRIMGDERPDIVANFCNTHQYRDDLLAKPTLWLKLIFSQFDFRQNQLFTYNDHEAGNLHSRMLSMKMDMFSPRENAAAYISHDDIEPLMNVAQAEAFMTDHHGETAEQVKERNERKMSRRRSAEIVLEGMNKAIWPRHGNLLVMDVTQEAREEFRCKTYHEICKHYNIT